MKKKVLVWLLALGLLSGNLAGCQSKETAQEDGNVTLRYWMELNPNAALTVGDMSETPFYEQLHKDTGVTVEYEHPPQGQVKENFNLMLASNDLPDIIQYNWSSYPGGSAKAIEEGYIVDHKELMEKNSPNFMQYLKDHPDIEKDVKTDNGAFIGYPFIRDDKYLVVSAGMFVRQDWLDDLGLPQPETIDDWTEMLTAFRDKKNASAPLSFNAVAFSRGALVGAFGVTNNYYLDNGEIKFGPIEPGFKDFLITMNKWYSEKLLDNNIASITAKSIDSNILNGSSGASEGSVGNGIGRLMASAPDDKFELRAVKYPVLNRGDKPQFGHYGVLVSTDSCAISANSEKKDAAAKFLDYGYSEKGRVLYNFGIEGESFNYVDGYPTYTDLIMKNPEGLSVSAAMARYLIAYSVGPMVQDKRYMEQYAALPSQKEAITIWSDTDADKHMLPNLSIKSEETAEFAKVQNAVDTYRDEMMFKFILGTEPISKFDEYVEQIKALGIEKNIAMYQDALARYNNR